LSEPGNTFPKGRLEALTDGIFAVAMTILVLDLHLPDAPPIHDQAGLIAALWGLEDKAVPYLLSFYVLGTNWLALSQMQTKYTVVPTSHARWSLAYLLLVTLVPFTTVIVGRYASYPVASWLYLGNLAAVAAIFHHLIPDAVEASKDPAWVARRLGLRILIFTSLLAAVLTPFFGGRGLFALALTPVIGRLLKARNP
jgi:uncharacterized membrane protein